MDVDICGDFLCYVECIGIFPLLASYTEAHVLLLGDIPACASPAQACSIPALHS